MSSWSSVHLTTMTAVHLTPCVDSRVTLIPRSWISLVRFSVCLDSEAVLIPEDAWRRERKLLHSLISITATKKYIGLIADESTLALSNLLSNPSDYRNYFRGYCYSVLTRIILGFSVRDGSD